MYHIKDEDIEQAITKYATIISWQKRKGVNTLVIEFNQPLRFSDSGHRINAITGKIESSPFDLCIKTRSSNVHSMTLKTMPIIIEPINLDNNYNVSDIYKLIKSYARFSNYDFRSELFDDYYSYITFKQLRKHDKRYLAIMIMEATLNNMIKKGICINGRYKEMTTERMIEIISRK